MKLINRLIFPERNSYVGLILEEVHIKEDLIYDKNEGTLIGFSETNNHLMRFEKDLNGEPQSISDIAGTTLVIMVRGLVSKLNFPYAQFA